MDEHLEKTLRYPQQTPQKPHPREQEVPSEEDQRSRYRKRMATYAVAALISLYGMTRSIAPDKDWTAAAPYVGTSIVLGSTGAAALSRRDRGRRAFIGAMTGPAAVAAMLAIYGAVHTMSELDSWSERRTQERSYGR